MKKNLIALASDYLGDDATAELARLLGVDPPTIRRALDDSVPTALSGFIEQASSREGAKEVYRQVEAQDDSILDDLLGTMRGAGIGDLISNGSSLLSSVFGSKYAALLPVLARVTGLDRGIIGKLLGFLGPYLLSVLSKQSKADGLDDRGIESLLASQRPAVADAMPAAVRSELGFARAIDREPSQEADQSDIPGWLLPVGLAAVAAVAYFAYQAATAPVDAGEQTTFAAEAGEMPTDQFETLQDRAARTFEELTESVREISGVEGLDSLVESVGEKVTSLRDLDFSSLAGEQARRLIDMLEPLVEKVREAAKSAYDIEGVEPVLRPALEPLFSWYEGFAGSQS